MGEATSRDKVICPVCNETLNGGLSAHIRQQHGEETLRKLVLAAKEQGMPDVEIGRKFGVSFNYLQQVITEAYGANISVLKRPKKIKRWEPKDFREETTTVWSFKQRGDWATHNGRYRGNWSPYIPRNVILKYSKPGDLVLDYFVGGGTTAIEAKLLGRRCIARDINPGAIGITKENLKFTPPLKLLKDGINRFYDPDVSVGDARDLSDIADNSVDLICAHPPYAGIIKYSSKLEGDLSSLPLPEFLREMRKVAEESLRVLKPGGKCAILVGDARKSKHVVPIGFQTIRVFLDAGFILRELVIKRQHNCKTTGFWYARSIQYNFLLLAHEYLAIFEKPKATRVSEQLSFWDYTLPHRSIAQKVKAIEKDNLETTTVWILPARRLDEEIKRNLLGRFAKPGFKLVELDWNVRDEFREKGELIYIKQPELSEVGAIQGFRNTIREISHRFLRSGSPESYFIVDVKDVRIDGKLYPMGMLVWEDLSKNPGLRIKEIVIVVPDKLPFEPRQDNEYLQIIHRYLLIFRCIGGSNATAKQKVSIA